MNKIIFLFVISLIITSSVFANAYVRVKTVNTVINSVEFDEANSVVKISGELPTRCAASPHPALKYTEADNTLTLSVEAFQKSDLCIAMIGGAYELAFDVRSLKYNLVEMKLNPDAVYILKTADGSLNTTIDFSTAPLNLPYANIEIPNAIFSGQGEDVYVEVENQVYEVSSPYIETQHFIGKPVNAQGFVVSMKPSVFSSKDKEIKPIFIVTGINAAAL